MNPAFLFGTAFNIAFWHKKYHSGTVCKGVSNPHASNALYGCEKNRNRNDFEEDIDRELIYFHRNLY